MQTHNLPHLKLSDFIRSLKDKFNILPGYSIEDLIENYYDYISNIPVRGAILMNKNLDKVLLVSNITRKCFGFPKGKINEGEADHICAIREVKEEIGYDIRDKIQVDEYIEIEGGHTKLYVVTDIP